MSDELINNVRTEQGLCLIQKSNIEFWFYKISYQAERLAYHSTLNIIAIIFD